MREYTISRKTAETQIELSLNLDGSGRSDIATGCGFLDHMLTFLALAGDFGATVSPAMVGSLSELAGSNLKTGLLVATIFPIVLVVGLIILNQVKKTVQT